ncbi:TonB-dependent receptor [Neisseria leonii]|uniref:TonB-dependent receptor n=2 Tax=Neisseria leonii TaxID=2995413 RepID=A0AAQ3XL81_9NEIS|nr:TonB-dependent receptor [Neisseria sp. 51.81]
MPALPALRQFPVPFSEFSNYPDRMNTRLYTPVALSAALCLAIPAALAESSVTGPDKPAKTTQKEPVKLPAVVVKGRHIGKPFETPAAVSRHGQDELGQDINTLIRTLPGTFTQHDIGQGGFAVNIRGLEGLGRVNTTVDGVSQTFYQTNPAHGWNGNTTYVDENFIAGIEVIRGAAAGAGGTNALAGHAELRTIDIDDLIDKDRNFGMQATYRQGSNGYGKNGMLGVAARYSLNEDSSIGFLSAVSGKRKLGYKNGAGETIASDGFDENLPMESGLRARSTLNKLQWQIGKNHALTLSHMGSRSRFTNNHSPLQVRTRTGLLKYRYTPLSDLVDLRADLSYTDARQTFLRGTNSSEDYVGRTTANPSWAFTLQNRSLFDLQGSDLILDYGGKTMRTRYRSNYSNKLLLAEGRQNTDSLFADARWQPGKWTVSAGIGYQRYGIQGYLPPTDDNGAIVLPKGGDIHFKRTEGRLNPRFGLAYQALDWLQIYTNIGRSSRSPNVQEFMYTNNVQGNPYSVNPYLKGETALNRDIGLNILKYGLLKPDDSLRLKAGYFDNRIKNFITQTQLYICGEDSLSRCSLDDYAGGSNRIAPVGLFLNLRDTVRQRGWEVEGGYDFGRGYINLSWSKTTNNFPSDYLADMGFSHIRTLPENVWSLDIGSRWLDNRLIVGARLNRTGKDTIAGGVDSESGLQSTAKLSANPAIIDLYASYQAAKQLKLFLNIDNLTNRVYNYPLSGGTLGTGNLGYSNANRGTGRGRTIYGGLSVKF